ncbi:hypothetical protein MPTK1_5g02640 [Marchantia polymorpha subsp. ruderalis]|nr:hypothetical protein MARPO_0124s0059 [Marchantia polymorpha]BBN10325.1 hypothetical protein Mp_5g02640 [Marchantia polymorpha subsp. ruderalis]|eukprot:PTQ30493.1 hypothetical protein MARPO_0124s0059 [Marchantia polymorpha]
MDSPSVPPVHNGKFHIINVATKRVLVDSMNRSAESTVSSTPFPKANDLGHYVDYFHITKSESGNDSWVIAANGRKMSTAGGEGIVLTILDDEPGFEWDFIASEDFPDAFRIENRDTHKIIYEREVLEVIPLQLNDVRYGKIELFRPEAHWVLKAFTEP